MVATKRPLLQKGPLTDTSPFRLKKKQKTMVWDFLAVQGNTVHFMTVLWLSSLVKSKWSRNLSAFELFVAYSSVRKAAKEWNSKGPSISGNDPPTFSGLPAPDRYFMEAQKMSLYFKWDWYGISNISASSWIMPLTPWLLWVNWNLVICSADC